MIIKVFEVVEAAGVEPALHPFVSVSYTFYKRLERTKWPRMPRVWRNFGAVFRGEPLR